MLPLLPLEQKGSGPSLSPPVCSFWLLVCLCPSNIHNECLSKHLPALEHPPVCCETEDERQFQVSSRLSGRTPAVSVWGPQGSSNDRLHVWKLAPALTRDSSAMLFPRVLLKPNLSCLWTHAQGQHCCSFFSCLCRLFSFRSSSLSDAPELLSSVNFLPLICSFC